MFDPLQIKEVDMATMELKELDKEFQHLTRLEMQDIIKTKEKEVKEQEEVANDRLEVIEKQNKTMVEYKNNLQGYLNDAK